MSAFGPVSTGFDTPQCDTDGDGSVEGDFTGAVTAIADYNG